MKAYKTQGKNGIEYELENGVVYKEYTEGSGLVDKTYPQFARMLQRGEVEIVDYEGSDKQQAELDEQNKQWALAELEAIREEAIEAMIESTPALKVYKDKLLNYKDNPNSQRPTR